MKKKYEDAVILAGGLGSRMAGKTKATLIYDHRNFLEKLIETLVDYKNISVSLNSSQTLEGININKIYDKHEGIGPISAICEGLKSTKINSGVLFIPCDTPNVTREFINYLNDFNSVDYDVIVVRDASGRIHPLPGIYKPRILSLIEGFIEENNFKLFSILNNVKVRYVELDSTRFSGERLLININTPNDYKNLISETRKSSEYKS